MIWGSLRKKIFASKKNDFWLKITNTKPITSKNQNLKKKKNCVLVCFFCMTVKRKKWTKNICAPLQKWIEQKKKLIIKNFEKKMQSFFLIFMPTLNYCISLSMNEKKTLCYESPTLEENRLCTSVFKVSRKKKNSWKTRSKFFIFLGLVFISQNLIMKWTRTLGWWKTCFKNGRNF